MFLNFFNYLGYRLLLLLLFGGCDKGNSFCADQKQNTGRYDVNKVGEKRRCLFKKSLVTKACGAEEPC